jgi:hypothetical protein
MLAGTLLTAVALTVPAAEASTQSPSRSRFCATARRLDDAYTHLDEVDPDESVADIEEGEAAFRVLAERAPKSLERPLARILRFMPILKEAAAGDLDISDSREGRRFVDAATTAGKAFDKLYDHLADKCDMDVN